MPEDHRTNPPAPDPATDIFLCRAPLASNGPAMPEGNCTRLFAHPVAGCTPLFYLSFRLDPADQPLVRRFESPTDAAAFILGMAGPQLAGIPGPEQDRIRTYFPGWFEGPGPDNGSPPAGAGVKPAGPVGEGAPEEEAAGRELPGILERDRVGTGNNFPAGTGDMSHPKLPKRDQQMIPEYFPAGTRDKSHTELPEQDRQMIPEYFPAGARDTSHPKLPKRDRQMIPEYFPAGAGDADKSNPELPEQDQQRIREHFPGWFGNRDADNSDPHKITPCSPVQGCDTGQKAARRPEIPTDPPAGVQPRNNPQSPGPGPGAARDPAPPGGNTGPMRLPSRRLPVSTIIPDPGTRSFPSWTPQAAPRQISRTCTPRHPPRTPRTRSSSSAPSGTASGTARSSRTVQTSSPPGTRPASGSGTGPGTGEHGLTAANSAPGTRPSFSSGSSLRNPASSPAGTTGGFGSFYRRYTGRNE